MSLSTRFKILIPYYGTIQIWHHTSGITAITPTTEQMIPSQNADDICCLGMNSSHTISDVKDTIPDQPAKRNMTINNAKTEECIIRKNGDTAWMKCKYLGGGAPIML